MLIDPNKKSQILMITSWLLFFHRSVESLIVHVKFVKNFKITKFLVLLVQFIMEKRVIRKKNRLYEHQQRCLKTSLQSKSAMTKYQQEMSHHLFLHS